MTATSWTLDEARFAISRVRDRVFNKHGYVLGLTGSVLHNGVGRDLDLLALPFRDHPHDPVLVANDIAVILMVKEWLVFDATCGADKNVRGFVFSLQNEERLVDLSITRCREEMPSG